MDSGKIRPRFKIYAKGRRLRLARARTNIRKLRVIKAKKIKHPFIERTKKHSDDRTVPLEKVREEKYKILFTEAKEIGKYEVGKFRNGHLRSNLIVNDREIVGLVDSGANRSLITKEWMLANFTTKEMEELDSNCKIETNTNIFDAQGKKLNIFGSYCLNVRHHLSNTRKVVFDVWDGEQNIFGTNILRQLQITIVFDKDFFYFYFRNKAQNFQEYKANLCKPVFVPPGEEVTIQFHCPALEKHEIIEALITQNEKEKKYFMPTIVSIVHGKFYIRMHNFSINNSIKLNQLKCNVRPLTDEIVHNLDDKVLNSFDDFTKKYPNIERFENKQHLPHSVFHLNAFYASEEGSKIEKHIQESDNIEYKLYDRNTLEKMFCHMDKEFGKGTCQFFTEVFLKHDVIAKHPLDAGGSKEVFDVPLTNSLPRTTTTYPIPDRDKGKLKSLLDYLEVCSIIRKMPANKSFGSPSFIISKKGRALPRLVVDSRNFNQFIQSETSVFMQSIISVLKEKVANSRFLSILDLKSAYYGIKVSEATIESGINNFNTIFGTYAFTCLLTGGSYSPNIFTSYILKHLHTSGDMSFSFMSDVVAHYDDLSLFSPKTRTLSEHLERFEILISRISKMNLKISLEKSTLLVDLERQKANLLGFEISKGRLQIPEKKLKELRDLPKPRTTKQAQSFVGSLVFYRALLGKDALMALNVISKNLLPTLNWNEECEKAFKLIKTRLTEELVVSLPLDNEVLLMFSDASKNGLGSACLSIPLHSLDLFQNNSPFKYPTPIDNALVTRHAENYDLPLRSVSKESGIWDLVTQVCNIYGEKRGGDPEKAKTLVINYARVFAADCLHKIENGIETDSDGKIIYNYEHFDHILYSINSETHEDINIDLILTTLSHILERDINIVFTSTSKIMKKEFATISRRDSILSPVWVGYNTDNASFCLIELFEDWKNIKKSVYNRTFCKDPKKIMQKILLEISKKEEKSCLKDKIKVVGFNSKALTPAQSKRSIFQNEAYAIWETLETYADHFAGNVPILLSDSKSVTQAITSKTRFQSYLKNENLLAKIALNYPNVPVFHIKGTINLVDFLSRLVPENQLHRFFSGNPLKDEDINMSFGTNKASAKLFHDLSSYFGEMFTESEKENNKADVNFLSDKLLDDMYAEHLNRDTFHSHYDKGELELGKKDEFTEKNTYIVENASGKIVLPKTKYFLCVSYEHIKNMHRGTDAIYKIVSNRYFCKYKEILRQSCREFCNSCLNCLAGKKANTRGYQGIIQAKRPSDCWQLDLLERPKVLSKSEKANYASSILICTDLYSKYCIPFLIHSNKAFEITNALFTLLSICGKIRSIHSDNGKIFKNKIVGNFCKKFNIKQIDSSPFVSKTRGVVENSLGQLRDIYRAVQKDIKDFSDAVPAILFTKNNIPLQNKLQYTPAEILYNIQNFKPRFFEGERVIIPTEKDLKEHFITLSEINQKDIYDEIFRRVLAEQKKNNRKKKLDPQGKYFVIKILGPRVGEAKNLPLFFETPFLCINSNKQNLKLMSLTNGQVVRRHVSQVKEVRPKSANNVRNGLPTEILAKLSLISFSDLAHIPMRSIDTQPVVTRSQRKKRDELTDDDNEDDDEVTFA